jgi:pSer/pThr/pTyr-binding forkhead associated (FHA) protein
MDVKLVVQKRGAPQAFHMRGPEMIIGRQKGCGVRIPSGMVSRQHCLLSVHDDLLRVEDLSSANGTLVNGRRIGRREILRPGDKLRIGPITFVVHYQLSQAALDRLLKEDDDQLEIVAVDDVEIVGDGGVELVLEGDEEGPLAVGDLALPPVTDPLDALAQIEAAGGGATAPVTPPKSKSKRKKTPAPPAPAAAAAEQFDDVDVVEVPPSPKRVKFSKIEAPAAEDEPIAISPADDDESDGAPEAAPDASQILGNKNWQLPTGQDIRDILAQLEKGKKA